MEFHMISSEDKNQIQKLMYIPRYLSSGLYGRYKQFSRFKELLGLLTQLQQDTKGNIMDIFLLKSQFWQYH